MIAEAKKYFQALGLLSREYVRFVSFALSRKHASHISCTSRKGFAPTKTELVGIIKTEGGLIG